MGSKVLAERVTVGDVKAERQRDLDPETERRRASGKALGDLIRARLRDGYMRGRKRDGALTTRGALNHISHETGIAYSSLWQFKEGMLLPGLKKLRRICDVLKINFEEAKACYPDGHNFRLGRALGGDRHYQNWMVGRLRFGEKLRGWLEKNDIEPRSSATLEEFSMKVGVVEIYIKQLMRGKVNIPSWKVCRRIAEQLGVKKTVVGAYKTVACAAPWMRAHLIAVLLPGEVQLLQDTQDADDQSEPMESARRSMRTAIDMSVREG
jgi:transcriptional regulator with XRE-family HTH domain